MHNVADNSIGWQCSLNDLHNDVIILYEEGGFDSPQNGKTQAPTNVKDVRKASNRAKQIKYLAHQIKVAPVNVFIGGQIRAHFFKSVHKSAKCAFGRINAQYFDVLQTFCRLFADFF